MTALLTKLKGEPAVVIGALISLALLVYQAATGKIDLVVALPLISGIVTRVFVTPAQTGEAKKVADAVQAEVDALIAQAKPVLGDNPTFDQLNAFYDKIKVYKAAIEASLPPDTGYDGPPSTVAPGPADPAPAPAPEAPVDTPVAV